jgi:sarcosine oxidase, subunit beta
MVSHAMAEVVVIGGGIAGLAAAVELRLRGIDVTVLEGRYPGAGNSGRNVGRLRRMQLTREHTVIASRAAQKWVEVAALCRRNPLLYPTTYALVLYADEERERLATLQPLWDEFRTKARIVEAAATLEAVPILRGGEPPVGAVLGDCFQVHHDAAVYAYLLRARELGARIVSGVEAVGLETAAGAVRGAVTATGKTFACDAVINAAGGRAGDVARMLGVAAPNAPIRREVLVTEPRRPFMTPVVTFYRPMEGWFNQTLRGEVIAGVVDPDEPIRMTEESTPRFLSRTARLVIEKAPRLATLRVVRQWAGVYDTTPDRLPLVGAYAERPGIYALNGWSGRGMMLAPISAELLADELAGRGRDELLDMFDPARFAGITDPVAWPTDYYSAYSSRGAA